MSALPSLRDPPPQFEAREIDPQAWPPLPRSFFERPVVDLARALLGCLLICDGGDATGSVSGGVIVETEAYGGQEDRASHARAGLTRRTAPMFGPAGHAYVYLVYGMHCCLNVVGDVPGRAGAVLIRAVEPRFGVEAMHMRRGPAAAGGPEARLAAGPARLCQALGVTRQLDGHDLTSGSRLWLAAPPGDEARSGDEVRTGDEAPSGDVLVGPRIGVAYAGEWADRPWRFGVRGSPSLSHPFPGERP